jgi:hypothetical protein
LPSYSRAQAALRFELFEEWNTDLLGRNVHSATIDLICNSLEVTTATPILDADGEAIMRVNVPIPKTYQQALADPVHGEGWRRAIETELVAWNSHQVTVIADVPSGRRNRVSTKYVFTTKQDAQGRLVRYKVRLVARGFSQRQGWDYDDTYAPVVQPESLNLLFATAAYDGDALLSFDIKTAYLHGIIPDRHRIYLQTPEGFPDPGAGKCYRFNRSAYGLKQAGYLWNCELDRRLKSIGFRPSAEDACLYCRTEANDKVTAIAVYVDDLVVKVGRGSTETTIKSELAAIFELTFLGDCSSILGMRVTRDREAGTIAVDQERYIMDIIAKYGYGNRRAYVTPAEPDVPIGKYMCPPKDATELDLLDTGRRTFHRPEDLAEIDKFDYRSKIGSLLYVAIRTRPDIANAVRLAAKYCNNPGLEHCRLVDRIFGYLRGLPGYRVVYGGIDKLTIDIWSDADHATDPDQRYSTSGTAIMVNGGFVFTKCRTQTCIAGSTMEAEYIALSDSVKRAIPIVRVLADIGYPTEPKDVRVFVDAEAAIAYTDRPRHNWRNAAIDRRYHSVRERYHRNEFALFHVSGEFNVADILTKNTATTTHRRHREVLFRMRKFPPWGEMISTKGDGIYVQREEAGDSVIVAATTLLGSRYLA